MKKLLCIIPIMIVLLLSSCADKTNNSGKATVYTSFYAVSDFTKTVAGDLVDVINLMPQGMEPHDFEPTATDISKLTKSDLFIYNGGGIDDWADSIIDTLPDTVAVTRLYDTENTDPHTWLSFKNAYAELNTICNALSDIEPQNKAVFEANRDSYIKKLEELENEYKNAGFGGLKMFVTHGAYGYLCEELGIEQVALEGISGESDPSPAQVAQVVDDIKKSGAKCIFYEPLEGDKTAQAVANEAGVIALPLSTFEADDENRDYYTVMSENLEQMKKGLK
ncbi:MAG: zinc ABC transporter substrate-binding protein [Clostridia bacterium]|nr:zinc ABC transporter substrate-binding protein [Clostridia bacterium]